MKFEHTEVFNFENALRGMRNPLDSWDKSDSGYGCYNTFEDNRLCNNCGFNPNWCGNAPCYLIGENDLKLARRLIKAGCEHRKFLRQLIISVDISAPRYFWSEADTYSIGITKNSCSTMHTLTKNTITEDMFEIDDIDEFDSNLISHLDTLRCLYNQTKDIKYFRKLKQLLPESFIQKRTVTINYENILNMINQRKNHRLKEWSVDFINWTKLLPYANELLFLEDKHD